MDYRKSTTQETCANYYSASTNKNCSTEKSDKKKYSNRQSTGPSTSKFSATTTNTSSHLKKFSYSNSHGRSSDPSRAEVDSSAVKKMQQLKTKYAHRDHQSFLLNTFYKSGGTNPSQRAHRNQGSESQTVNRSSHTHETKMSATAEAIDNLRRLSDSIKKKI